MTIPVREFDELPAGHATELIRPCCGATRWVAAMVARRPFGTLDAVLAESDDVWGSLEPDDWREAFAHHPRIGEPHVGPDDARGAEWSAAEQAGARGAAPGVQDALVAVNREYEARFGYVFIVCATGKSAEEMLAAARARLANAPDAELRVAAEELRQITRLRLTRLLADDDGE